LTTEFIHGVKINNVDGMKALGINPVEVRLALSLHILFFRKCHLTFTMIHKGSSEDDGIDC